MKNFEIARLLDFYSQLLTQRQKTCLDLHYNADMSLLEIAEQENISRQAVFDAIKKGEASLIKLENSLQMIKDYDYLSDKIDLLIDQLNKNDKALEIAQEIKNYLDS